MCDIRPVVMQRTGKNHCIPCYYKSLATASNHRTISVHVKINSVHVATTNVRHLQRRQNIRWRQILTAKPVQNKMNHSKCTNHSNIHAHIGVTHANANGNGVGSFNDDSEPTCISQHKWSGHPSLWTTPMIKQTFRSSEHLPVSIEYKLELKPSSSSTAWSSIYAAVPFLVMPIF